MAGLGLATCVRDGLNGAGENRTKMARCHHPNFDGKRGIISMTLGESKWVLKKNQKSGVDTKRDCDIVLSCGTESPPAQPDLS